MTAAQRRTVTVKIGGDAHRVEITADVQSPDDLAAIAEAVFSRTHPGRERMGMGFGQQIVSGSPDRQPAGSPWQYPATAKGGDPS